MSTNLFHTAQLAIAELALSANVEPFSIRGLRCNFSYQLPDGTWVNPTDNMTSKEQFQSLYENAHYYRLYVASNPIGTNRKTGAPNGKAIYSAEYVESAQQTTNGDMFNMFKKFDVKQIGKTEPIPQGKPSGDVNVKIEQLRLLKAQGTITALEFAESVAALQTDEPTKGYNVLEKIKKTPKQNKPIISDGTDLPVITAKAIKGGYEVKISEFKKHKLGIVEFDETFTATLKNDNGEFIATGKWVITTIRKTAFSIKRFVA